MLRSLLDPADTRERHLVVARLLGLQGSVLDVGGAPGRLAALLPRTDVVVANVRGPADVVFDGVTLPFPTGAFDAVTSVDVVEHLPREARAAHLRELARVARGLVVACWPLGSPAHEAEERELAAWYEEVRGRPHPYLAEHLRLGLPDLEETRRLAAALPGSVEMRFHGDRRVAAARFRELTLARSRPLYYAFRRVRARPALDLDAEPRATTNRVFVVAHLRS